MDQSIKQKIVAVIHAETARFATREEMRADVRQIVGVFAESIDEKFKLAMEALDNIFHKLDEHDKRFDRIDGTLERKSDVEEVDALDRRVTALEGRRKPT